MKIKALLTIAVLILTEQLHAQIVTDRPNKTESSSTVAKGDLQVETGFLLGFEGNNERATRQLIAPVGLFRYGVVKGVEARLITRFERHKSESDDVHGIGDMTLGTKIQLLKDATKNSEIALVSHVLVPTGTEGLTSDRVGTTHKLSVSHTVGRIGIGYNIGYSYPGRGSGDMTYSLAIGTSVNEKVGIYIEPYGAWDDFDELTSDIDAGILYLPSRNVQLDFSFATGITRKMNYLAVGASWLIKKE